MTSEASAEVIDLSAHGSSALAPQELLQQQLQQVSLAATQKADADAKSAALDGGAGAAIASQAAADIQTLKPVMVTLADFDHRVDGAISDDSTFIHIATKPGNLKVLQSMLGSSDQSQPVDFLCFVVGPPLKPLPDQRQRETVGGCQANIIPRVAEILIDPPVGPGDIVFDVRSSRFVLTKAKEPQVRHAVKFLETNGLLSLDGNDAFSLVLVRTDFKPWLEQCFDHVFGAVLAQKEWTDMLSKHPDLVSHTTVTPRITFTTTPTTSETTIEASVTTKVVRISRIEKITKNCTLMLLESIVADFSTLGAHFHGKDPAKNGEITCLDHLLLKLWTFAHWVYCERFCGYDHRKSAPPLEDFKKLENGCPECHVKNSSMSFFCYYCAFSRKPLPDGFDERESSSQWSWQAISDRILSAALKLPRRRDALYRGMKPPLEGVSFRIVKKDEWRNDKENPRAHGGGSSSRYRTTQAVDTGFEKKIVEVGNPSSPAAPPTASNFQENRNLFLEEGGCGLTGVQRGDLLLMDQRISSYSSDPGTAMRYSSITGQRYPSTVIIIEDGFGLANQFTIVPNVRELRDAELQVCPDDEFVVKAVQRDVLWRQRFVEGGSGVEPVWSVAQYHEAPEVGVAAVPYISTDIDPTNRIEVYVFKRTGPTDASECFERWTETTFIKNRDSLWWTLDMGSRRVSHIVKLEDSPGEVSQEISVHFHRSSLYLKGEEMALHVFSFKNTSDRQQYPHEIQTVRDTMVLKWLINLNTSPGYMLHTLPQIGPDRMEKILALRQRELFRDLDHFDERLKSFPRKNERGSKDGAHRHGIRALVTFGQKVSALPPTTDSPESSFRSPDRPSRVDTDSLKHTPGTVQKRTQPPACSQQACTAPPNTLQLADEREAFCFVMGDKETARKALKEVLSRLGCLTLEKVTKAAGGGENGNYPCNGGLLKDELERLISHFRVCDGKYRSDLISMLRELLTYFGIPY